jgi:hypothetical protein
MFKKLSLIVLLAGCLLGGAALSAQSNDLVDELIDQKPVKLGHAAYLVLSASGKIPETATVDEAATYAIEHQMANVGMKPGDPLPLDQLSNLIMKSLDIKGGLFYSLFGGPRYALREMIFLRIAANPAWPDKLVAGDEALRMLNKAMEIKEKK